jgi:hypothetical protein
MIWDCLPCTRRSSQGGRRPGCGFIDLIPLVDLPVAFLAFFYGVRMAVALRFPARVFEAPTPAPGDG